MKKVLAALAAVALTTASASAQAATFAFDFTMNATNGDTYVGAGTLEADAAGNAGGRTLWQITGASGTLDTNPGEQYATSYAITGAPGGLAGSRQTFTLAQGGVTDADFALATTNLPIAVSGDFANGFGANYGGEAFGRATLSIKAIGAPSPAVPEPATWGLMLVGFGAAGVALRRRRTMQPAHA